MQTSCGAAKHVAFSNIVGRRPCSPSNLTAHVGAKDVGGCNGANVRVVDTDESGCFVCRLIMDHLPVVFWNWYDIIIVGILCQVDGLLPAIDIGKRQNAVGSSVNVPIGLACSCRGSRVQFQLFPIAIVETLPLRSDVD